MLVQVEKKLQELENERNENYYKKKTEDLVSWGLASRTKGKNEIPIIVTDEEYEELLKADRKVKLSGKSKIGTVLNACSIILLAVGACAGVVAWIFAEQLGFIWFSAILFLSVIFSLLFKGMSEIIFLLQDLAGKNSETKEDTDNGKKEQFPPVQPDDYSEQFTKNAPPVHYSYPGQEYTRN